MWWILEATKEPNTSYYIFSEEREIQGTRAGKAEPCYVEEVNRQIGRIDGAELSLAW